MKRIGGIFTDFLIFLLLIICFAYAALTIRGIQPYVVISGSMEPEIPVGSVCLVDTKTPYNEICVNDIISFEKGKDKTVTHRVVSVTREGIATKGDANKTGDGITTTESNYRGKTIAAIPYAGYAVFFLKSFPGKILIAAAVCGTALAGCAAYGKTGQKQRRKEHANG